jgi:hypothetical protein
MRKLFYIFLIFIVGSLNATTFVNLENDVRELIRDTSTGSGERAYSQTTIQRWLNEAQTKMITYLKMSDDIPTRRYTIDTVTGTREYDLPPTFLEEKKVWIVNSASTNTYERIDFTTINKLDKTQGWEDSDNGEPTDYYIRYTTDSVQIGLYPEPDGDHSGLGYLRIDYVPKFDDMVLSTSTPFNDLEHLRPYHDALVYYACFMATRDVNWYKMFIEVMDRCRADLNKHDDFRGKVRITR